MDSSRFSLTVTGTVNANPISCEFRPHIAPIVDFTIYYPEIEPPPGFFQIMRPISFPYHKPQLFYYLIFILNFDIIYLENIGNIKVFEDIY